MEPTQTPYTIVRDMLSLNVIKKDGVTTFFVLSGGFTVAKVHTVYDLERWLAERNLSFGFAEDLADGSLYSISGLYHETVHLSCETMPFNPESRPVWLHVWWSVKPCKHVMGLLTYDIETRIVTVHGVQREELFVHDPNELGWFSRGLTGSFESGLDLLGVKR